MRSKGVILLLVTALLVVAGCFVYVNGFVAWAQFFWVLASGTAGAGIVILVENRN
jgi:hypothetical protein